MAARYNNKAKLQTEEGKDPLRGSDKAGGEWTLVCLVPNIKKIYARIRAKGRETDDLTRELQATCSPV